METENGKDVYSAGYESGEGGKLLSFTQLNGSLEKLLLDAEFDYSDADIVVEGTSVGVNRCILASRSPFFHELFKKRHSASANESKPKYFMTELVPYGNIGYEAFMVFLNYVYTGKLKASPPEVSTCVDDSCAHDACAPAINFAVELMYASATFQIKELVSLLQRRLLNFVDKAFVEDVIPVVDVAFHCQLNQLLSHCVQKVACSDLDDLILDKELHHEVLTEIKSFRKQYNQDLEHDAGEVNFMYDERIRRIHKALDSDDIELLKLLQEESDATLDDAFALHYAAAYCHPKVVSEVLSLGNADLNLRNSRGYTVLHIAARRKDPSVIVALLREGASVLNSTISGQTSVTICRRLTRPKDYYESKEQGQESNKDRLCIDILEREMLGHPVAGTMSMLSMTLADDLVTRLLYFENRVAFARLLFPQEAKLAMEIAYVDSSSDVTGFLKTSCGNLTEVDLNETPYEQVKRLHSRLQALQRTVGKWRLMWTDKVGKKKEAKFKESATGVYTTAMPNSVEICRRYFPKCTLVLDSILDDDWQETLEEQSTEEQIIKKMRYIELKEEVMKAFSKDKAEINWVSFSSSSSCSSSIKCRANIKVRKRKATNSIDGQMSITICRRLTQPKHSNETTKKGQASDDRFCIDVRERGILTNPMAGSISMSPRMMTDDFVMRLVLLENRVWIARSLFPSEVKLKMEIADADSSLDFRAFSASNTLCGNLKMVNLNENPYEQEMRLQAWLQALRNAVEKSRRFYPSCCEVLGRFLEDGIDDTRIKEMRFMEIKEEVIKAFETDKARLHPKDLPLSSPSESDTLLLERARKLLRGNNLFTMGLEEAMMVFNNVDKDGDCGTRSSPSSSGSISSVNQVVRERELC